MLRRTLENDGWTVSEAANGRVALERVRESVPDLILLDLMMPEMDGFEFVAELRKNDAWRSIPVVVVTAKDLTPEDRQRLEGNVREVFQKGELQPRGAGRGDPRGHRAPDRGPVESAGSLGRSAGLTAAVPDVSGGRRACGAGPRSPSLHGHAVASPGARRTAKRGPTFTA